MHGIMTNYVWHSSITKNDDILPVLTGEVALLHILSCCLSSMWTDKRRFIICDEWVA